MKFTRFALIGLSLWLIALLVGPSHLPTFQASRQVIHASWINNPKTLAEAHTLARSVVVARVVAVKPAPDIVVQKGTSKEQDRLPNQRVRLEVTQTLAGKAPSTLVLFHGGDENTTIAGDPIYKVGETYVLFVMDKDDEPGTQLVIGPEGRYLVENNTLRSVVDHKHAAGEQAAAHDHTNQGLAAELDGTLLSDLHRDLARIAPAGK